MHTTIIILYEFFRFSPHPSWPILCSSIGGTMSRNQMIGAMHRIRRCHDTNNTFLQDLRSLLKEQAMNTSLWVSAGWLLLLLAISLSVDTHSPRQHAPVGTVLGQSSCLTSALNLAQDTELRTKTKPGVRCKNSEPACYQNAFMRQKQTAAPLPRHPTNLPTPLKGDRRHG